MLGRKSETMDYEIDVDLSEEGKASKISRQQVTIR